MANNLNIQTNMAQQIQQTQQQPTTSTNTAAMTTPVNPRPPVTAASQQPSQITKGMKERAEIAKNYIASKYTKRKTDEDERKEGWEMLE